MYVDVDPVCVGEDRYSLCIDESTGDENRGDRSFSLNNSNDDIIEVFRSVLQVFAKWPIVSPSSSASSTNSQNFQSRP